MSGYPDNPGPLPAEKLCNKFEPNPVKGLGPLGNEGTGKMHYSGGGKKELVITLQKMLVALGYDLGDSGADGDGADGDFGKKTEEAIIDFQQKNKDWNGEPLKAEGLVGPETSDALNRRMVGAWYDHYQTPAVLTEGKPYHAITTELLKAGFTIKTEGTSRGKLFLTGPVPEPNRWYAAWERQDFTIKPGEKRKMIVRSPRLSAGQKVVFQVIQEAQGKEVAIEPPVCVEARDGIAEGEFGDWYGPDRVTYYVRMQEGESDDRFPSVTFKFTVKVSQKLQCCSKPISFDGDFSTTLIRREGDTFEPLADVEYILYSPWGKRVAYADEQGKIKAAGLPPGDVTIVIDGEVILTDN